MSFIVHLEIDRHHSRYDPSRLIYALHVSCRVFNANRKIFEVIGAFMITFCTEDINLSPLFCFSICFSSSSKLTSYYVALFSLLILSYDSRFFRFLLISFERKDMLYLIFLLWNDCIPKSDGQLLILSDNFVHKQIIKKASEYSILQFFSGIDSILLIKF